MNRTTKVSIIAGTILVIGIAGAILYSLRENEPAVPKFSYDSSNINDWWASENVNLQELARSMGGKYTGEEPIVELPIADLTIHHGDKKSNKRPDDQCFTAFSYYDYPIESLEATYANYEKLKSEKGDLKILEPKDKTMATFEGDKEYELRQYNYTIEGEDVLSGYEVGYILLESAYIRVEGVCKTAEDLEITLPILDAVTLNES